MPPETHEELKLLAYHLPWGAAMPLVPAGLRREWMDATRFRNATHCLPLLIANQSGWWLLNSHDFEVVWDGGKDAENMTVTHHGGTKPFPASSHFGHGILTFQLPYLFRTPPGWNLLARGPANLPKDGAAALEGVTETDWATVTFTMNWQITRPHVPIAFRAGEPVCQIVPQRRGELESLTPQWAPLAQMPDADKYLAWRRGRHRFRQSLQGGDSDPQWQLDYMAGRGPDGQDIPQHQRRLRLREFAPPTPKSAR